MVAWQSNGKGHTIELSLFPFISPCVLWERLAQLCCVYVFTVNLVTWLSHLSSSQWKRWSCHTNWVRIPHPPHHHFYVNYFNLSVCMGSCGLVNVNEVVAFSSLFFLQHEFYYLLLLSGTGSNMGSNMYFFSSHNILQRKNFINLQVSFRLYIFFIDFAILSLCN